MTRFMIEGKSVFSGEVIYGRAFEAESLEAAAHAARKDYEGTHSGSACTRIEFDGREQPEINVGWQPNKD